MFDLIAARIESEGPLRYSDYVAMALYHPDGGFYATDGHAGRRGDFVTSPEVGPLFGACIANLLDEVWKSLGRPDPFTFLECGAGPGTLARSILVANPACADALDYIAVEGSARQRARHPEGITSEAQMPVGPFIGMVFANELLDNLPFDVVERSSAGWRQVRVGLESGTLRNVVAEPIESPLLGAELAGVSTGTRVPLLTGAGDWLRSALDVLQTGVVLAFDYGASTAELAERGGWMRTYRGHERGIDPFDEPGCRDITIDVPFDQLANTARPESIRSQGVVLRTIGGIDALVAEGKAVWRERAHIGDLAAVKARSRIGEAEALLDPDSLGSFQVVEWRV